MIRLFHFSALWKTELCAMLFNTIDCIANVLELSLQLAGQKTFRMV